MYLFTFDGMVLQGVTWIDLNGFCNSFDNLIHFAEKIVRHDWFAMHEIWGYWLEEEQSFSFVFIIYFDDYWCRCFCVFMFASFSFAMFPNHLCWELSQHGHSNMFLLSYFGFVFFLGMLIWPCYSSVIFS